MRVRECVCVRVCACVFEREREREKERERDSDTESLTQEHSVHKRDLLTLQKRPTNTTKEPYLDLADSVKRDLLRPPGAALVHTSRTYLSYTPGKTLASH